LWCHYEPVDAPVEVLDYRDDYSAGVTGVVTRAHAFLNNFTDDHQQRRETFPHTGEHSLADDGTLVRQPHRQQSDPEPFLSKLETIPLFKQTSRLLESRQTGSPQDMSLARSDAVTLVVDQSSNEILFGVEIVIDRALRLPHFAQDILGRHVLAASVRD